MALRKMAKRWLAESGRKGKPHCRVSQGSGIVRTPQDKRSLVYSALS